MTTENKVSKGCMQPVFPAFLFYFSLVLQGKNASVFTISRLKVVQFQFFKKEKLELKNICQTSLSTIVFDNVSSFYEFFKNKKIMLEK
jgi:hypothetical protein